jgi:hypothetical protein
MIGSTFAAGSLPIDLTLIAVDASLGSLQRGVAEVQADPGSLKRLAGVLDPSTRFIDQSASAFLESTTLGCELLVRRVEPVLALARCPFALVSDSLAILSNSVATGRGLITPAGPGSIRPESSAVSARSVLALPRLARGNLSGLSHASTLLADLRRSAVRWTRFPAPRQPGAALHDPILDVRREPDRTHGDGAHHFGGATNAAGG